MRHPAWQGALVLGVLVLSSAIPRPGRAATIAWQLTSVDEVAGVTPIVIGHPTVIESEHGLALAFDGQDDGLLLSENPIAGWPRFTIEVLFRPDAPGGFEQRFLHVGDTHLDRALIELRLRPDGQWYLDTFMRSDALQRVLIDDTKLHPAGQWYWVALRYDGTEMAHFVNGVCEKSGAIALAPLPPGKASLGMRMNRVSWFRGAIREVRFHDHALAPEALQRIER